MLNISSEVIHTIDVTIEGPMVAKPNVLGRLIYNQRKRLGLSQEQVAEAAGIRQHYVSQIERGKVQRPGDGILIPIAKALDLSMADVREAMGWIVVTPVEGVMLHVAGRIPADSIRFSTGQDGASMDEIEVTLSEIADARSPYALEVSGDCFRSIGIYHGDVVIVEPADGRRPRDQQIVVVRIGDEVTLKRWVESGDIVQLQDGDGTVIHEFDRSRPGQLEVIALYVTYKPLAPR